MMKRIMLISLSFVSFFCGVYGQPYSFVLQAREDIEELNAVIKESYEKCKCFQKDQEYFLGHKIFVEYTGEWDKNEFISGAFLNHISLCYKSYGKKKKAKRYILSSVDIYDTSGETLAASGTFAFAQIPSYVFCNVPRHSEITRFFAQQNPEMLFWISGTPWHIMFSVNANEEINVLYDKADNLIVYEDFVTFFENHWVEFSRTRTTR